ncbi:GNAT family protein [Clostridium sp. Marseille-Q2269]|uniref:GNAT family N-acetyltransferase n=1 Tax=Clostridium sp. Marseille-Q2269 TaxID=2942205 RepID=UPI002072D58B|nr:GNAT family protein [Clostridium sp. Marseille-Q2269]
MIIEPLLNGKELKLTAIEKEDIETIASWYRDVNFLRYYDMVSAFPKNKEQVENIIKDAYKTQCGYIFAIRNIKDDKIIGVTGLEDILWNNGTAIFYIGFGAEEARGKGYGSQVMELILDFAFKELNLHRIHLTVLEYNHRAIRLYEKMGFKREGVYREFIHRDGKRYDLYMYGILRREWESLR